MKEGSSSSWTRGGGPNHPTPDPDPQPGEPSEEIQDLWRFCMATFLS